MEPDKDNPGLEYKAAVAKDEDYLKQVAQTLKSKGEFDELHFEYLSELLEDLGINIDPYKDMTASGFNAEFVESIAQKSFDTLQNVDMFKKAEDNLYRLFDYLAAKDTLEKSDLIFVFGGPSQTRAELAISLFKQGYGKKLLFTGSHSSHMPKPEITEAGYYAELARGAGISDDDMILERNAINTPENAVNSISILKTQGSLPQSIILITMEYHMRRALLTFETASDWSPKLIRQPAQFDLCRRDNFYQNLEGWKYVFYEYIKLYGARLMKHF